MEKLNPPSPMQLVGNLAYNWKRFKQRFNIYLTASGAGGEDKKLKASIFLQVIGEDALDIYNSFQLDEAILTLTPNFHQLRNGCVSAPEWRRSHPKPDTDIFTNEQVDNSYVNHTNSELSKEVTAFPVK
ncbi:hypothetical protein PO909_016734 [Leuciscus waleckii]